MEPDETSIPASMFPKSLVLPEELLEPATYLIPVMRTQMLEAIDWMERHTRTISFVCV